MYYLDPKVEKMDAQKTVDWMKAEKRILINAYPKVGEFGNCLCVSIGEQKYMQRLTAALEELDRDITWR